MATTNRSTPHDTVDGIPDAAARRLIDGMAEKSAEASQRLADAAGNAGVIVGDAVGDADRMLRASSDQTLGIIGSLSLGFVGGLLVSGASRLLIGAALAPALLVAAAAWDRLARGTGSSQTRTRTARPG